MDFFTNLHFVMSVVALVLVGCAWPLFVYRSVLREALTFALEPDVKETINPTSHRKYTEMAQEEYTRCDKILVPIFQIGLLCIGGLWLALAYGVAPETMPTIVAGALATVMTMLLTQTRHPVWFTDWSVAMMAARNKCECDRITKLLAEDQAALQKVLKRVENKEVLTDEEQDTIIKCVIRVQNFEMKLANLKMQADAMIEYSRVRDQQKKEELRKAREEDLDEDD